MVEVTPRFSIWHSILVLFLCVALLDRVGPLRADMELIELTFQCSKISVVVNLRFYLLGAWDEDEKILLVASTNNGEYFPPRNRIMGDPYDTAVDNVVETFGIPWN